MHPTSFLQFTTLDGKPLFLNMRLTRICAIEGHGANNTVIQYAVGDRVYSQLVNAPTNEVIELIDNWERANQQQLAESRAA